MAAVVLLVGPKGSGKSTIGMLLQRHLGIAFLRVEPIYLEVLRHHGGEDPVAVEPAGFAAILEALERLAVVHPVVCLESTGTAGFFPEFLRRLRARHHVVVARIFAPPQACIARVRARDATAHIPVSDERLAEINRAAEALVLPWDFAIDNTGPLDEDAIARSVRELLPPHPPWQPLERPLHGGPLA